ncbi:MAG: hypothetical protein ATN33_07245 [Epulopiscium sp. Nele67-Bin001]|nr:MAG: hypothetical protein BEN18_10855 [Epulopiscium sp. Nuni2H_MBin001]OON92488.1 MAG: hypothetical protein ATN33_07245 [Epulopiscium sp. Nele67-Bin001]
MKKIINQPETMIVEMCNGLVMAHPELEFLPKFKVIKKSNINKDKVSLISGGGSGHEPAHAGFVGEGMLDAAVCGDVFASPSQIQVYEAIKAAATDKGVLLIIKNYSGDIMNFKNAAHLATEDGINVEYIKVEDDIAVMDSLYTVGRRGVAGTIYVHKIAGAAAQKGWELQKVKEIAQDTADNVRSMGFAFTSCTVPAKGTPTFELADDEMEFGVGIHGEPGIERQKVVGADELAIKLVEPIVKDLDLINNKQEIALLINGFGATPLQELYVLNNAVRKYLSQYNIVPVVTHVGNYMTSIDMAGASISILRLCDTKKELLLAPSDTPGFKVGAYVPPIAYQEVIQPETKEHANYTVETDASYAVIKDNITLNNLVYIIDKMAEVIIANEVPFCDLDSHAGDGDFGMSVAKGFRQLKAEWNEVLDTTIGGFLNNCAMIIMEHCGGASGPIWGSAFRAASRYAQDKTTLTAAEFAQLLQATVEGIQATGERSFGRGAGVGDKTLMDALIPTANVWQEKASTTSFKELFELGAQAAVDGAKKTEEIVARMGRAGTVGERSIGYPDAGAHALGVIFTEITNNLKFE